MDKGYAARVDCIQSYRNISNDLLQRFVSPIVPQGCPITADDFDENNLQSSNDNDEDENPNDGDEDDQDEEYDSDSSTEFSDSSDNGDDNDGDGDDFNSLDDEYSGESFFCFVLFLILIWFLFWLVI